MYLISVVECVRVVFFIIVVVEKSSNNEIALKKERKKNLRMYLVPVESDCFREEEEEKNTHTKINDSKGEN